MNRCGHDSYWRHTVTYEHRDGRTHTVEACPDCADRLLDRDGHGSIVITGWDQWHMMVPEDYR